MPWINIVLKSPEGCSPTAGPADDSSFLLPHHHLLSPHGGQLGGGGSHSWGGGGNAGWIAGSEPSSGIELTVDRSGLGTESSTKDYRSLLLCLKDTVKGKKCP